MIEVAVLLLWLPWAMGMKEPAFGASLLQAPGPDVGSVGRSTESNHLITKSLKLERVDSRVWLYCYKHDVVCVLRRPWERVDRL